MPSGGGSDGQRPFVGNAQRVFACISFPLGFLNPLFLQAMYFVLLCACSIVKDMSVVYYCVE